MKPVVDDLNVNNKVSPIILNFEAMKNVAIIILLFFAGCKDSESDVKQAVPKKVCDPGKYGDNCEKLYGYQLAGTWNLYVSAKLHYYWDNGPGNPDSDTLYNLYNNKDVSLHDSIDGVNGMRFFLNDFWGNGEVAYVDPINVDSFYLWVPQYNKKTVYQDRILLCKANNYSEYKTESTPHITKWHTTQITIKMVRK